MRMASAFSRINGKNFKGRSRKHRFGRAPPAGGQTAGQEHTAQKDGTFFHLLFVAHLIEINYKPIRIVIAAGRPGKSADDVR